MITSGIIKITTSISDHQNRDLAEGRNLIEPFRTIGELDEHHLHLDSLLMHHCEHTHAPRADLERNKRVP